MKSPAHSVFFNPPPLGAGLDLNHEVQSFHHQLQLVAAALDPVQGLQVRGAGQVPAVAVEDEVSRPQSRRRRLSDGVHLADREVLLALLVGPAGEREAEPRRGRARVSSQGQGHLLAAQARRQLLKKKQCSKYFVLGKLMKVDASNMSLLDFFGQELTLFIKELKCLK